jgi:RNA polymerase sigma factor (sigma-70 family)
MNWKQVDKLEFTDKELEIINFYCADEMYKLKKICNPLLSINKVKRMNYDDLYSDALKVLIESVKDYDGERAKFETYLTGNIRRSFYDWMRDSLRWKRCNLQTDEKGHKKFGKNGLPIPIYNLSFDYPTDDGEYLKDIVPDTKNYLEDEIELSPKVKQYLHSLSNDQLEVTYLIMEGQSQENIKEILNLTQSEFNNCMNGIKAYENISILF